MRPPRDLTSVLLLASASAHLAAAVDVLKTNGFSTCLETSDIKVDRMNIAYDRAKNVVTFDVGGTSKHAQEVDAELVVTAYGREVYRDAFDPCDKNIAQLCPIPQGTYHASGSLPIPTEYLNKIPSIAFQIPDLDGMAKLILRAKDTKKAVACLASTVENGKSASTAAVSYVTAGVAAAALGLSALSAAGSGATGGGPSPSFADVMGWFQFIAFTGMNSIDYPPVYRSFASNFGWSTGMISLEQMQRSIDKFRQSTGGNLTEASVDFLNRATLVYSENTNDTAAVVRRDVGHGFINLVARELNFGAGSGASNGTEESKIMHTVHGVQGYVEKLKIPSVNTFMTVLLVFCIVIATVAVFILLFKVILEAWALCGEFPQSLRGFRKRYWLFLASTIVRIIFILYGTWALYCLYQFSHGDSWGAHALAGATLGVFTAILLFFAVKIFTVARKAKKSEGGPEALYENKPYMRKYGLFYDQFKSNFYWIFVPMIVYAFVKAAFLAFGDGHGLIQVAGQLACEGLLLILLLWSRPFNTRTGNVLNIIISVVRVLSVLCLLVFVHELGIAADTKSITGVALIVIQSVLTATLAILIAVNAIFVMCKKDKRKKQRELEKQRDAENLTPLDPRASLLFRNGQDGKGAYQHTPTHDSFYPVDAKHARSDSGQYPLQPMQTMEYTGYDRPHGRTVSADSSRNLVHTAAPIGASQSGPPQPYRQY